MITEEENIANMRRCPKFESCNIPFCPLDFYMFSRIELPEDPQCPLRKLTERKTKKRREGILSPKMRGLLKFVWEINKK